MKGNHGFTDFTEKKHDQCVWLCPELDIASQGVTHEEGKANLIEALELFFETASESEISIRLQNQLKTTRIIRDAKEMKTLTKQETCLIFSKHGFKCES